MNNNRYTDTELNLMSYQQLRRLSILLKLPANIKKHHMVSMIQAHQNGDGCTKRAIVTKVLEERKIKKRSAKVKQSKPLIMSMSKTTTQQIPTDLSLSAVATNHEFEARFSYVAHYSSKDNKSTEVIKEETEVSRRCNRSIIQQTLKPAKKLSTSGKTEIMLPRNHSLTTPVRLMPQFERGFVPPGQYEFNQGYPFWTNQDFNPPNYYFHRGYSTAVMPSYPQKGFRSEPYWCPARMYNSSNSQILPYLLNPNSQTRNSCNCMFQQTPQNMIDYYQESTQEVHGKLVGWENFVEHRRGEANYVENSVAINSHYSNQNHFYFDETSAGGEMRNNVEYEINSDYNNCNRQQHIRREDMIIRHANEIDPYSGNINSSPNGYSISSHNFIQKEETLIPEDYTRHENNGSEVTVPPDEHLLLVSTNTIEQSKLSDCSQPYPRSCDYINEEERSITQEKIFPYESKIKLEGNGCILTPPSTNIGLSVMNPCNKSISSSEIVQNESWESKRINETYIKSSCSKCHYSFCQSRGSELLPKRSCEPPSLPSFVSTFRPQPENGRVYSTSRNFSLRTSGAPYNSCLPISSDSRCSVSNSYTGSSLRTDGDISSSRSWDFMQREQSFQCSVATPMDFSWNCPSNFVAEE